MKATYLKWTLNKINYQRVFVAPMDTISCPHFNLQSKRKRIEPFRLTEFSVQI